MTTSGIDLGFWFASFFGELVLVCILLKRRQFSQFPFFLAQIVFALLADPVAFWLTHRVSQGDHTYIAVYTVTAAFDYMLELGVLIEIANRVLRPGTVSYPVRTLALLIGVLTTGFALILLWVLGFGHGHDSSLVFYRLQDINLLFAFLRLLLFAAIAGFSQMLGITWKNHVIRLAAGLAFYSAVSVVVQLTLSHLPQSNPATFYSNYYLLQRIQVIAYLGALSFWAWSFAQKDAPRREFTPQMQRILVTISQATQRDRVSLTRNMGHK